MTEQEIDNYLKEREKAQQLARLKSMGWQPKFNAYSFEKARISEGNRNNFNACKAFVEKPENLYIYGTAGNGKTYLAWCALLGACNKHNAIGRFISWEDFEREVLKDFDNRSTQFVDNLTRYKFVVLDDIFREAASKTTETAFVRFIDTWANSLKKGLILTSNDSLQQLAAKVKNDRVVSRIAALMTYFVENTAPDYRTEGLAKKTIKANEKFNFMNI
jgi:ATPase involved in DNA replication initiation